MRPKDGLKLSDEIASSLHQDFIGGERHDSKGILEPRSSGKEILEGIMLFLNSRNRDPPYIASNSLEA